MATSAQQSSLLTVALGYADRGWPVFPCHPKTKRPLVAGDLDPTTGKRLQNTGGYKKASSDPVQIKSWWARWSKAMIGLPVGTSIGAFVLDLDTGHDQATGELVTAKAVQQALEAQLGLPLPSTWTCTTPRGGRHYYFAIPPGCKMPGNRAAVVPRVDVRGDGGYVILPPSARADGIRYAWTIAPEQGPLAVAPMALLELILPTGERASKLRAPAIVAPPPTRDIRADDPIQHYGSAALEAELRDLAQAPPGTRNDHLFHSAIRIGQLVAAGAIDSSRALTGLENVARGWPSLQKSLGTIRSGYSKGVHEPRDLLNVARPSPNPVASLATPIGGCDPLDLRLAQIDLTDRGNATRFVERRSGRLAFCNGGWVAWDGSRWSSEGADAVALRAVHETVDAIKRESEAARDHEE